IVAHAYATIRGYYVEVARRAVEGGIASEDTDPQELGAALYSLMAGFLLQRVLIGEVEVEAYVRGVHALIGPTDGPWVATGRTLLTFRVVLVHVDSASVHTVGLVSNHAHRDRPRRKRHDVDRRPSPL